MTSTAHRENRASRILLVPLLICAVCCALGILGCRHEHGPAPESDLDAARSALVALFEEADAFDVYRCAGGPASEEYLGTVSRGEGQGLWHELIGSLHRAGPPVPDQCGPSLRICIREGEKALADVWSCPPVGELRVWLAGRGLIEVTVDSPFKELLRSYHDKGEAAVAGESSSAERPQPEAEAPLPTFEEVKERLARLFHRCDYINIRVPGENAVGIDIRAEGGEAWQMMTEAVEEAEKGWAIPGKPEIMILCLTRDSPGTLAILYYVGGVLGAEDRDLGANVRTLRPAPSFKQGLDVLLGIAREKERREQQTPPG